MREVDVSITGIKQVWLVKKKRAKRLNISLKQKAILRISIPFSLAYKDAENLIKKNIDWIEKYVLKMEKIRREHEFLPKGEILCPPERAKRILSERINDLAEKTGLPYNGIKIREFKTKWGSCAAENIINLNLKLVSLPARLRDYVIIHELIHTKIKNHGFEFWNELERYLPEGRRMDRELKKYNLQFL